MAVFRILIIAILLEASFPYKIDCGRQLPRNCAEVLRSGGSKNGIYQVDPTGHNSFSSFWVYCDQTTDGGGWAVIVNRIDGSVDFNRNWDEYKVGFGDLGREHWLGLNNIHYLTLQTRNEMRVDVEDFSKNTAFAKFNHFYINGERDFYKLAVGSYSGTAGDSMAYHNGMKFTTKDKDNDIHGKGGNCAVEYGGGWWFKSCYFSFLTGPYHHASIDSTKYFNWYHWKNKHYSLKSAQMKIRPLLH